MLIEEGTTKEFKAVVLDTCTHWPQYDEVYAADISKLYAIIPSLRSIEYWVLVRMEWKRREMATIHGTVMLPLKPELMFEFKKLFQDDDIVAWRPQKSNEILLTAQQWERGLARCSIKFAGFVDDPGIRNEVRVQGVGA